MPATAKAIAVFREKVGNDVPLIHYAKGSGHLHGDIRNLDLDFFGAFTAAAATTTLAELTAPEHFFVLFLEIYRIVRT